MASGDSITVPVEALGVPDRSLGAANIEVLYDPTVLDATACTKEPGGIFDAGFCNVNFDNDGINPDAVRFNVAPISGVSGDLLLANITFQGVGQARDSSVLDVLVAVFADPGGDPIPVSDQDGQVCITPCETPTSAYLQGALVAASGGVTPSWRCRAA